ncbi:MAG: response regulator transcription factor [Myxococcaceae bacterium]|nr:response regulator transcription factor [Myxococcaceae bacterium]
MKVLVVDDEAPARRRLSRMLVDAGVEIAGEAEDGEAALKQLAALKPDALFLDIRMPKLDGLTLAARWAELPPIVFVTAYDEHAVKAFEVNAVDYLLKPVRPERLGAAVERLRKRGASRVPAAAIEAVSPAKGTRIVTSARGTLRFFEAKEIARFWSSDKYTLFSAGGEEHMTEEPLDSLEARLGPHGFLRVHRAELIQLAQVKSLSVEDGITEAVLADGQRARVSRRSTADLRRALGV